MKGKYAKFLRQAKQTDEHWVEIAISDFTDELIRLMDEQNMSRAELGEKVNCSQAYLSKVLNGYENLTLASMTKFARALGTVVRVHLAPPEVLVRREDKKTSDSKVEIALDNSGKNQNYVR